MIYMMFFRPGKRQKSPSVIPVDLTHESTVESIDHSIDHPTHEPMEAHHESLPSTNSHAVIDVDAIHVSKDSIDLDWDPPANDHNLDHDSSHDLAADKGSAGNDHKVVNTEVKTQEIKSQEVKVEEVKADQTIAKEPHQHHHDHEHHKHHEHHQDQSGKPEHGDEVTESKVDEAKPSDKVVKVDSKVESDPAIASHPQEHQDDHKLDTKQSDVKHSDDTTTPISKVDKVVDKVVEKVTADVEVKGIDGVKGKDAIATHDQDHQDDQPSKSEVKPSDDTTPKAKELDSIVGETHSKFESGVFTVDGGGQVTVDFLFDGGKYKGELAIFSLDGMDKFEPGSQEFIQEAARRALSNSTSGYVVISDPTEGAKFFGEMGDKDYNSGAYLGAKTFAMQAGDEFGLMLVANGRVQQVFDNPGAEGALRPLFSMATANPDDAFHVGQIADVTGNGNTFVMEDLRVDTGSDKDYNDIIFQVRGATGTVVKLDEVIDPAKDWRDSDLGKEIIGTPDLENGEEVVIPPETIDPPLPVDPLIGAEYISGAMMFKFDSTATGAEILAFAQSQGAIAVENLFEQPTNDNYQWKVLHFALDQDLVEVRTAASQDPIVSAVELDYKLTANNISSDSMADSLWGLNNTGQTGGLVDADIDIPEAWRIQTGSKAITVAVIDTGGDYRHPDLAANTWRNQGEVFGNGVDDDRNGFVDDVHGYDFVNKDGDPMDDQGHGTHVAGTIGAVGNNNVGVVGVNQNVSLMHLKFLNSQGSGSTIDAIRSVDYATRMGANVINASFGGGGYSQAMFEAINRANNAGVLFVAAAGNEGNNNDFRPSFPANYDLPNVISVAATDHRDQLAGFSNFGQNSVDLGAPGVDILSTLPGNRYGSFDGTSMAAPHVAGAAALILAENSNQTPSQLKSLLMRTADPVTSLQGRTVTGGRLNVNNALSEITTPPKSTISMTVTDGSAAETKPGNISNPGKVRLTRSGGDNSKAETVAYGISGTATNGVDYSSLSGSVTFAAGQSSVDIPINIIDDNDVEGTEKVTISLLGNSNYNLGTSIDGTILIADNDFPGSVQWIRQFGTSLSEGALDIAVDNLNNSYVVGANSDAELLIKYDSQGSFQWSREFNDLGLFRVVTDNLGDVYAAASAGYDPILGNELFKLLKYNSDGVLLWSKPIDSAFDLHVDVFGNIYVSFLDEVSKIDIFGNIYVSFFGALSKYDPSGNLIWQKSLEPEGLNELLGAVTTDAFGNSYAVGQSIIVKYDSAGNQVWLKDYKWGENYIIHPRDIAIDSTGNLYVGGASHQVRNPGLRSRANWLSKYDNNGNQLWEKTDVILDLGPITKIEIDSQDNLFLNFSHLLSNVNTNSSVVKTNNNGTVLWTNNLSSGNGYSTSIALGQDRTVYATGVTKGNVGGINAGGADIWIAKLNA